MLINADFNRRAVVRAEQYEWVPSPQPGVERVMLDRIGAEKARATSLVRYAPGSSFPAHRHPGGEEILVLKGEFMEDGRPYPAGWYLRSPPGSSHVPSSPNGATLFVKLWQMTPEETQAIRVDTNDPKHWRDHGGRAICTLLDRADERVCLQRISPHAALFEHPLRNVEILVLAGFLIEDGLQYNAGSWLRFPSSEQAAVITGDEGATIYLRSGRLIGLPPETVS